MSQMRYRKNTAKPEHQKLSRKNLCMSDFYCTFAPELAESEHTHTLIRHIYVYHAYCGIVAGLVTLSSELLLRV